MAVLDWLQQLLGGGDPEAQQMLSGGATDDPRYAENYARNQQYVSPGQHAYNTQLGFPSELGFRAWLGANKVPFDPGAGVTDYDMRGFYQALRAGNPIAASAVNPNDNRLHYPDYWKTPYHETFSNNSQWALPNAPRWTQDDRLIDAQGNVLFDERARK